MKPLQKQRNKACQRDGYYRKVERENLDGYGWTMSLDTVRTPEEILLVKQRMERFERHIDKLQPRVGRVLRLRLGINCKPHSLAEIAEQYGVCRGRVQQIEAKATRILARRIFIEEKPEQYRRERDNVAKVYKERIEAERLEAQIEAEAAKRKHEADWSPEPPAKPRDPVGRFVPSPDAKWHPPPPHQRTILDEIVKEQHRALALEREQRSWAAEREAWLRSPMPSWVVDDPVAAYPYKLRKVPIKRDWLKVATEGFNDGA